jgi:hypothetical protein
MMIKSSIIIGAIIATLLSSTTSSMALASTGFDGDDFTASHIARPPINPDF